ncbi:hypothetical protein GCM10025778_33310 [Paeniglutamicibacter antarcticus]|uniref:Uncharacterized protein n=1 Tax=Paeniglutamicibacter antarcticus TaxID=494023 RepID=A0ABP9TSW7_9MICC
MWLRRTDEVGLQAGGASSARPLAVASYTYEALPVEEKAVVSSPDASTEARQYDPGSEPEA